MENISNFLSFCESFGIERHDLFQTVDLYEGQNIPQVIVCTSACLIHSVVGDRFYTCFGAQGTTILLPHTCCVMLSSQVQTKCPDLPSLGPKESEKAPRTFTEDQIQAGKGVIGLQMGSNRGASQAGMNFGLQRQIIKD